MEWYDGTTEYSEQEISDFYPKTIVKDIRANSDKKRIVIINSFLEDTNEYELANPHKEKGGDVVFYHIFYDDDSYKVNAFFNSFILDDCYNEQDGCILLMRKEPDKFFSYSYGHICKGLMANQEFLIKKLFNNNINRKVFILPLKAFMFKCPVCGTRTLSERGMFLICTECGWEDTGDNDPDVEPFMNPNGTYTIRQYREEYLKLKENNPYYRWKDQFEDD